MPRDFRVVTHEPEVLVPLWFDRSTLTLVFFQSEMVARLKPGVTIAQADAIWDASLFLGRIVADAARYGRDPRPFDSWRFSSVARPLKDSVVGGVANVLWLLMATIGIVMLIACANVANLVLVRAEGRQQEFAVRTALGAGRGRLIGEWLLESVLLGLLGGAIGTAIAYAALLLLKAIGPETLPRLQEITIDAPVLAFAVLVSILSGILFGLIPPFKYAGRRFSGCLRQPRHQRQPRTPSHAQRPGRRAGGAGARTARELGADDSHVLCAPRSRARIRHRSTATVGIAIPTSVRRRRIKPH